MQVPFSSVGKFISRTTPVKIQNKTNFNFYFVWYSNKPAPTPLVPRTLLNPSNYVPVLKFNSMIPSSQNYVHLIQPNKFQRKRNKKEREASLYFPLLILQLNSIIKASFFTSSIIFMYHTGTNNVNWTLFLQLLSLSQDFKTKMVE